MFITNPTLLRVFNQTQATYGSVYHREDGKGFSVKFTKGDKEFMFYAELVLGDEHLRFSVPCGLLRASCVTSLDNQFLRWDPCHGNREPDTDYRRLVLDGLVLETDILSFCQPASHELDDVIAETLLHLMNQLQCIG
jgi:hypothetical protein